MGTVMDSSKKNIIWHILWAILQITISISIFIATRKVFLIFGVGLVGNMYALIIIAGIGLLSLGIIDIVENIIKIGLLLKKKPVEKKEEISDLDKSETGNAADITKNNVKKSFSLFWAIFHTILGIGVLIAIIILFQEFEYELVGRMDLVIPISIALFGLSISMILSSIRIISKRVVKKIKVKAAPGLVGLSLVLLVLLPILGGFYYFSIYAPEQKLKVPMNRGPFLFWRNDTRNTMVIAWDSIDEKDYTVKWGTSKNGLSNSTTPSKYKIYAPSSGAWEDGEPIGYRYYVELTGLSANTSYYYTVASFIESTYSFKTSHDTTEPFTFQVVGDTRRPNTQHGPLVKLMGTYPGVFVINIGDTCNNGYLDWNQFFEEIQYQANERPYQVAIGNHEYGNEFGYYFNYDKTPNDYYYSHNYSNAHFLYIDNFDGTNGYVSAAQKQFIIDDLKRNVGKKDWIIVSFHVPIFSTGDFNYDWKKESDFMPIFTQYGVDLVLTGHDHHYESFNISKSILENKFGTYNSSSNGMMQFVCGGGGSPLDIPHCMERNVDPWGELYHNSSEQNWQKYMPKGSTASTANYTVSEIQIYGELAYQFMQIDVNGRNMNISSIRLDGSVIEAFQLSK
jgi:calcineurin-like phosphoesterase family protein/purple acid phosphatase-like protein